eukprot:1149718-Pelagomonas_calceolata.AAC.3
MQGQQMSVWITGHKTLWDCFAEWRLDCKAHRTFNLSLLAFDFVGALWNMKLCFCLTWQARPEGASAENASDLPRSSLDRGQRRSQAARVGGQGTCAQHV